MADNLFNKKAITFPVPVFLAFFWLFSCIPSHLYAQPLPVTDTVTVTAKVGEDVIVTSGGRRASGVSIPKTAVRFSGQAYPGALVRLLKGAREIAEVKADSVGEFTIMLEESYDSDILYSLFAEDVSGNRSLLVNYPIAVRTGFITYLSGIRFAPTITTDKSEVRFGDYITINGYALPEREMQVDIQGTAEKIFTLASLQGGAYKIVLPLSGFSKGEYYVSVRYVNDLRASKLVKFTVGESNIFHTESVSDIPGDCNADKVINLVDFSILAFWYGKDGSPPCVDTNSDKIINLVDFSILAFYWTS